MSALLQACPGLRACALTVALIVFGAPAAAEAPAAGDRPESMGYELGDFSLRDLRVVQGSKTRMTFTLHASVSNELADAFEDALERRRMRVRDQVITAMRLADPEEFQDPQLELIRRRLHLRLRRAVPELPIEAVYFSDFRYFVN